MSFLIRLLQCYWQSCLSMLENVIHLVQGSLGGCSVLCAWVCLFVCMCGWLCVCMHGCVYTLIYGPFCCLFVYLLSKNVSCEPLLNRMTCHCREGMLCKRCLHKKIIPYLFVSYKFQILNLWTKVKQKVWIEVSLLVQFAAAWCCVVGA